jgi:serine/threonine protein kinase
MGRRIASAPHAVACGPYELLAPIGAGGMGEVFLARTPHAPAGPLVVIKRLRPELLDHPGLATMFLDEARTAARIEHPNVCRVLDLGRDGGQLYMALEYLEGVTFAELIVAGTADPELASLELLVGLLAQIGVGLHHAHTLRGADGVPLGIVHRDVNPKNLFVTTDGVAKLLDFGVAKARTSVHRTQTGAVKGTYAYLAPEQLEGEDVDPRSDVFALGVVAWEAIARRRLFRRASDMLTWRAVLNDPIPPIARLRPDVPGRLAEVIDSALNRDREARPGSAGELAALLRGALGVAPASPPQIAAQLERSFALELAAQRARIHSAPTGARLAAPPRLARASTEPTAVSRPELALRPSSQWTPVGSTRRRRMVPEGSLPAPTCPWPDPPARAVAERLAAEAAAQLERRPRRSPRRRARARRGAAVAWAALIVGLVALAALAGLSGVELPATVERALAAARDALT